MVWTQNQSQELCTSCAVISVLMGMNRVGSLEIQIFSKMLFFSVRSVGLAGQKDC